MAALQERLGSDCPTTVRMRTAAEAYDIEGVLATTASDVVLRSPVTDRVVFRGHEQVREVLRAVFATLKDMHYFVDVGDQRTRALFYTATVGTQPIEEALRVELNENAKIQAFTIFYRPLPGLATFAAAMAPRVARRHGRLRSLIARVLISPLALLTRLGDRLVPWFV
jgi:SnoaL-like protein